MSIEETREVALCCMSMFCDSPLTCNYAHRCARPGEAISFINDTLKSIGQPSLEEQWRMSEAPPETPHEH